MTGQVTIDALVDVIRRVRELRPLVHSITSPVVMNWTANVCLAVGASPIMAQAPEELDEICDASQALNLNTGMLEARTLAMMVQAGRLMVAQNKPVVLDPVGVGASHWRLQAALQLVALKPCVLRANAGEVAALTGADSARTVHAGAPQTRGVDSLAISSGMVKAARSLAAERGLAVAMTGATDIITDGRRLVRISGGSSVVTRITGGGCALSALVAACAAVEPDVCLASMAACAFYKGAAEHAAMTATGPGSLAVGLLDALASDDIAGLLTLVNFEEER